MLKGSLMLVLAYVAAIYCAAVPEGNASPEYDPNVCGNEHGGHNLC